MHHTPHDAPCADNHLTQPDYTAAFQTDGVGLPLGIVAEVGHKAKDIGNRAVDADFVLDNRHRLFSQTYQLIRLVIITYVAALRLLLPHQSFHDP
jgi:hypothetical protein